ncbi:hypothetical protein [Salinimicrobium sp. GXAS 041]|uniref:hypothetical protein n=1 Tax=Salinimicrobium sp. GXAS 041 TaxID=3400806 RepID=UPI003C794914
MQVFKRHIAILLLAGFLFPQVVSGMHYLVVSHSYSSENSTSFKKADRNYLVHTCHYYLNSFPSVLPSQYGLKNNNCVTPQATLNFFSLEDYVHQEDFNFQLRGPPFNCFPEFKIRL